MSWRDACRSHRRTHRGALVRARRRSIRVELRRAVRKLSGSRRGIRICDRRQVVLDRAVVHARVALHGDSRSRSCGYGDGRARAAARAGARRRRRTEPDRGRRNADQRDVGLGRVDRPRRSHARPVRARSERRRPSRRARAQRSRAELRASPRAGRQAVSAAQAVEPCLTAAEVSQLAGTDAEGRRRARPMPVEIEWAMDDDGFTMLQARPLHLQAAHVPDDIWLHHPRLNGHPGGRRLGRGPRRRRSTASARSVVSHRGTCSSRESPGRRSAISWLVYRASSPNAAAARRISHRLRANVGSRWCSASPMRRDASRTAHKSPSTGSQESCAGWLRLGVGRSGHVVPDAGSASVGGGDLALRRHRFR